MKSPAFSRSLLAAAAGVAMSVCALQSAAQNQSTATVTSAATEAAVPNSSAPIQLSYGVPDVLKLARAKVGDETIVAFVGNSGRIYNLSAAEIVQLREQGVSDRVLTAMLEQRKKLSQTAITSISTLVATTHVTEAAPPPHTAQPAVTYVQTAPAYVAPAPVYVVANPAPTYIYRDYYPYYRPYVFPALSFSFGFGGSYHGGGGHGGHR